MKVFVEQLLQQWSEKCEDGKIDYTDPKKIHLLQNLIQEIQSENKKIELTLTYDSVEDEYDAIIRHKFGYIPVPEAIIKSIDDLNNIVLSDHDKQIFKTLYPLKPTTKSGAKNHSGTGKGELSLYWLLAYRAFEVKINSKSNSNLPDLIVRKHIPGSPFEPEFGIEIKSFEDPQINLGRFQRTRDFGDLLEFLNISYTLSTVSEFTDPTKRVSYSTLSVNPNQLQLIFTNVCAVKTAISKTENKHLFDYNLENAIKRLEHIYTNRTGKELPDDNCNLTQFFISELIKTKLYSNPGLGGYIINIQSEGTMELYKIDKTTIESQHFAENCVKHAIVNGGSLRINFDKIFDFSK
jgi:hypothetical protein